MIQTYKPGQVVELGNGRTGTVQFAGQTSFADGDWVGVILEEPSGKNDGSVKGMRYFDCEPNHGMFLRPTGIARVLEEPTPMPPPSRAAPHGKPSSVKQRPSSIMANGVKRPSQDLTATKRQSINAASPSPAPRTSLNGRKVRASATTCLLKLTFVQSPSKLASRGIGSSTTSTASSSRGATPPIPGRRTGAPAAPLSKQTTAPRPSLGAARATTSATSNGRPSRPSLAGPPNAPTRSITTSTAPRAASVAARQPPRASLVPGFRAVNGAPHPSARESTVEPLEGDTAERDDSLKDSDLHESPNGSGLDQDVPGSNFAPPTPQIDVQSPGGREELRKDVPLSAATSRHIQDLETQINVHKKKCDEYRAQLGEMERLRAEKDRYQSIIEKLQSKLQPQSQELIELKGRWKESEKRLRELENTDGDHETELEMATLDREMAEEHAEAARLELDALKERMAELQDEVEVLREENNLMSEEVSPEERSSQGWVQLERSNERLKEALIRLREITQDKEAELVAQISSLEDDMKELSSINAQYEETRSRLEQSEAVVESLKEQLDEALDAESTTEKLTADNIALQDQMDQLRINIKELEDLQELNDELEYNHVEAEKQMQEELDYKDSLVSDQTKLTIQQDEKLTDYETTIIKFRELVVSLQSSLEDMRASQQITEVEAEELNTRSKAMNDLNLKLQSSADKAQMNTIDLEARRLEAQEALEHLAIVQTYLPDSFKAERDSVATYLRFRRISSKSRLLHSLLKGRASADSHHRGTEDVFVLCDILDKLVWVGAMCDRFVSRISGCSIDEFARYQSALHELDPVERGLDVYVDGVRKGELKEQVTAEELQRTTLVLSHLAEVHLQSDDLADYADNILMRTSLMQSYLENTAVAMSHARVAVMSDDGNGDDEPDPEDYLHLFDTEAQSLISQTRSAKITSSKLHAALTDLKARSMSLEQSTSPTLIDAEDSASSLARLSRQLGSHIHTALMHIEADTSATDPSAGRRDALRSALRIFISTHLPDTSSSSPLPLLFHKLKHTSALITRILDFASNLKPVSEFLRPEPPWSQRATALRTAEQDSQNTEAELLRLRDTMQSQSQQLRSNEQKLDESAVKIELLEARTKDAAEKASRISQLSASLEEVRKRERDMLKRAEGHTAEVATLNAEKDHWRNLAETRKGIEEDETLVGEGSVPPTPRGDRSTWSSKEIDALKAEIDTLTASVRFLREDSRRTKFGGPEKPHMSWLLEPLFQRRRADSEDREQKRRIKTKGKDCWDALRSVVLDCEGTVVLKVGQEQRGNWRSFKDRTSWKVARQREEWELWRAMAGGVVFDCTEANWGKRQKTRTGSRKGVINLPKGLDGKELVGEMNGHATAPVTGIKSPPKHMMADVDDGSEHYHDLSSNVSEIGDDLVGVAW